MRLSASVEVNRRRCGRALLRRFSQLSLQYLGVTDSALEGMRAEEAVVREAVRTQLTDIEPSDLHASADYRRPAAACLTVRAIWTPTAMQ
jgi:hypothetical protein